MSLFIEMASEKLIREWNRDKNTDIDINTVMAVSGKKVWWKCEKGHEWQATISHRMYGRNCPICSGKKILIGYNDLLSQRPDIAEEWNYEKNKDLTPQMVTRGSTKRVWWKCKKGHEWSVSINSRTRSNSGCPVCYNKNYRD